MAGRILLVEDEAALRGFAAGALRAEGYEVIEAADGLEAWAIVKQSRFDLLITDSKMPHLSGTQLTVLVRELHPTLPILRLCGTRPSGPEEVGVRILVKPFEIDELVQMTRSLVAS